MADQPTNTQSASAADGPRRDLTMYELRDANTRREELWLNGSPSTGLSFALIELAGEVGEACNEGKKLARHELGLVGGKTDMSGLEDELADVMISCDLAAKAAGIDLAAAVRRKFNATSNKYGFDVKL